MVAPKKKKENNKERTPAGHDYGRTQYWDAAYASSPNVPFDWYQRWPDFSSHVLDMVAPTATVLDVGCGNSRLAEAMADDGFRNGITAIDLSHVVIEQMTKKYARSFPSLRFLHANACAMPFPDESFDVAIAKATLDVMLCGDLGFENVVKTCAEVCRVLRPGGVFLALSFDGSMVVHLDPATHGYFWTVERVLEIPKPLTEPVQNSRTRKRPLRQQQQQPQREHHHLYVCRKKVR